MDVEVPRYMEVALAKEMFAKPASGTEEEHTDIVDLPPAKTGEELVPVLSLIHISEPTRLGVISYAVFCL